jgi:thymidylate kinase
MSSDQMLELIDSALSELRDGEVRFVHWKSNEHLGAALRGETDLDLLVDPFDRDRFLEIVDRLGFLPMEPPKERRLPGLESFIGLDPSTGTLVHLDVHFQVVLGEQLLKNHHLPVEAWLLDENAKIDGVPVPQPERELLILYVRSGLKTKTRQIVRAAVKGGSPYPANIRREAGWLAGMADSEVFPDVIGTSGLPIEVEELAEFHRRAIDDRFEWRYVLDQKRRVLGRLRSYQRMPWYQALPRRTWLRLRNGSVMKRLGVGLPPRHLAFPTPLVAAVGADGSGKTRLTRDLEAWLGSKLLVRHVYFGQPKSGIVFKLLNKPGSMIRNRSGAESGALSAVARYTEAAKWLWLARLRRRLARSARASASRGTVVLAERYPLDDFFAMQAPMDGPRLQPDGAFAGFELAQYRAIDHPDLTLVLHTSLETLRERKEDLTLEEHIPKVEAIEALADGPGRVRIDVGRPYEEVLLEAKHSIWKALSEDR